MCQVTIGEVTGLTSGGVELERFRIGGTATDCPGGVVSVEVRVANETVGAGEAPVSPTDDSWELFVVNGRRSAVKCGSVVTVVARCGANPGCEDRWADYRPECEGLANCPQIRGDLIVRGVTCAGSGNQTVVEIEVRLASPPVGATFHWTFDDGSPDRTTTVPVVTHPYSEPGPYAVGVMIVHEDCTPVFTTDVLTVPPCCREISDIVVTQQVCTADFQTAVTFLALTVPENAPGPYTWTVFDGQEHVTEFPTWTHIFAEGGEYTVEATLTPPAGSSCPVWSHQETVLVDSCAPPCPTLTGVTLTGDECVTASDGTVDGSVRATFEAAVEPAGEGSFAWTIDGASSPETGSRAVHVFGGGGEKSVRVEFTPARADCPPSAVDARITVRTCAPGGGGGGGGTVTPRGELCKLLEILWIYGYVLFWIAAYAKACDLIYGAALTALLLETGVGAGVVATITAVIAAVTTMVMIASLIVGLTAFVAWLVICSPSACRIWEDFEWANRWTSFLVAAMAFLCMEVTFHMSSILVVLQFIALAYISENRCRLIPTWTTPWSR